MKSSPAAIARRKQELDAEATAVSTGEVKPAEPIADTPVIDATVVTPLAAEVTPAPAANVTQTPPAEDPNSETFEARWKALKGIADHQGKDLRSKDDQIARLEQTTKELLDALSAVQAKPAATPEPVVATPAPIVSAEVLTEDEDDILGGATGTMAQAVRKLARSEFSTIASTIETRIKNLEDALRADFAGVKTQVEDVAKKSEAQLAAEFNAKVSGNVREKYNFDYFEVVKSQQFNAWLDLKIDRRTKNKYLDIYAFNVNEKDVEAINGSDNNNGIIDEFMADSGIKSTSETTPPAMVVNQPVNPTMNAIPAAIRDQIAPARSSAAGIPSDTPSYIPTTLKEATDATLKFAHSQKQSDKEIADVVRQNYYLTERAKEKAAGKR